MWCVGLSDQWVDLFNQTDYGGEIYIGVKLIKRSGETNGGGFRGHKGV
jgi:hypothetical protein